VLSDDLRESLMTIGAVEEAKCSGRLAFLSRREESRAGAVNLPADVQLRNESVGLDSLLEIASLPRASLR
jgi:hypothetical protein